VTLRRFAIVALILTASGVTRAGPEGLELDAGRLRCYGAATISVRILAARPELMYRWQTSVRGAVVERDTLRPDKEGAAVLEFTTPDVERVAPLRLQVEALRGEDVVGRGQATFLVFPSYQPDRLKKALGATGLGVAASRGPLFSLLEEAGVDYRRIVSRTSLELFEGDILIATGEWLDGEGSIFIPLIRRKVHLGLHLIVLEPQKDWRFFPFERQIDKMPVTLSGLTLLPDHPLLHELSSPDYWRGTKLIRPVYMGAGGPCNLRVLSEETGSRLPLLAEVFPPGKGVVLFVAFPVASSIETDPSARLLLERCLRYLARPAVPPWRHIFTLSQDAGGAAAQRLGRLGVQVSEHESLSAQARDQLLVEAYERLEAGREENQAPQLPHYIKSWVQDGNDALILVGGAPSDEPIMAGTDMLTKGIPPALLRCLSADEGQAAGQLPDFGLEGKSRVLISGLLARIDLGRGRLYVLRDGFREDGQEAGAGIPHAWSEFLSIVLTNLAVRIEGNPPTQGER